MFGFIGRLFGRGDGKRLYRYKLGIRSFFGDTYYGQTKVEGRPDLSELGITDVRLSMGNTLEITLSRPNLLIGKKGKTIEKLQKFVSIDGEAVRIKVIESRLWSE
jgi:ribosomal protein S3